MALDFMTGVDYLDTSQLSSLFTLGGSPTISTTANYFKDGTRGVRCASSLQSVNVLGLTNAATRVLGFYIRFNGAFGELRCIASIADGTPATNANNQVGLVITATGALAIYRGIGRGGVPGGTQLGSDSANLLTLSTWYFIEIVVTVNNTTGTVEVYVDGSKAGWIDLSSQDTQSTANAYANAWGLGGTTAGDIAYDNIYSKSDGTRFGPGAARSYVPDANGAVRQWTPSTGSNDFSVVDEIPPNGDTDYLESTSAGNIVTMGYPAIATTNAIKGLQVLNYARTTSTGSIRGVARIGGTDYFATCPALSTSYGYKPAIFELSPDSGVAWTESEIDGAEFGTEHTT